MNDSLPKVLVISSTPFSQTANNGKTLSSFFGGYDKENIAQLSFSGGDINPTVCNNYYILTLSDVIKGRSGNVLKSKKFQNDNIILENADIKKGLKYRVFHSFSQKRNPFTVWIKNLIWKRADCTKIYDWVEGFDPDIVFFQGFSMAYGYEITLDICKKFDLPLILELTDDYTQNLYKFSLLSIYNNKKYLNLFQKAISYAKYTIVISPKMKTEYESRFGGNMEVMMNSVEINETLIAGNRDVHDYVYAGNVLLNRWRVLTNFAKALKFADNQAKLSIYTPDIPSKRILKAFGEQENIIYGGRLNKKELEKRLSKCGSVVFVESFDKLNKKITRLSLSTKVPEYMASGALIVAIGPKDVGSMEYLKDNSLSVCILENDINIMSENIKYMLSENFNREEYISRSIDICQKEHNINRNAQKIKEMIINIEY